MQTNQLFRVATALCLIAAGQSSGQVASPESPVMIREAIELARKNYPAIRAEVSEIDAAESGVALSETAYLPRADFHYQVNRATRNNVFGL
ncbi:MAG: hypothetical protein GY953_53310, partial [bacterium]|nr:hypothetical protein [bacterium]